MRCVCIWIFCLGAVFTACSPSSHSIEPIYFADKTGFRWVRLEDVDRARTMDVAIWYPVEESALATTPKSLWRRTKEALNAPIAHSKTKYPLIILSHGYLAAPESLAWLAEALVDCGFVVAGVQHHDLDEKRLLHIDHWHRPLDVSRLITFLTEESDLSSHLDASKIGIAGHSMGGLTAMWIAGAQASLDQISDLIPSSEQADKEQFSDMGELLLGYTRLAEWKKGYTDPRVKAFVLMAPAFAWIFPQEALQDVQAPMLIFAGQSDYVINTYYNARFLAHHLPNAALQVFPPPAGHFFFLSYATDKGKELMDPLHILPFLQSNPYWLDRNALQKQMAGEACQFFHRYLD